MVCFVNSGSGLYQFIPVPNEYKQIFNPTMDNSFTNRNNCKCEMIKVYLIRLNPIKPNVCTLASGSEKHSNQRT